MLLAGDETQCNGGSGEASAVHSHEAWRLGRVVMAAQRRPRQRDQRSRAVVGCTIHEHRHARQGCGAGSIAIGTVGAWRSRTGHGVHRRSAGRGLFWERRPMSGASQLAPQPRSIKPRLLARTGIVRGRDLPVRSEQDAGDVRERKAAAEHRGSLTSNN